MTKQNLTGTILQKYPTKHLKKCKNGPCASLNISLNFKVPDIYVINKWQPNAYMFIYILKLHVYVCFWARDVTTLHF